MDKIKEITRSDLVLPQYGNSRLLQKIIIEEGGRVLKSIINEYGETCVRVTFGVRSSGDYSSYRTAVEMFEIGSDTLSETDKSSPGAVYVTYNELGLDNLFPAVKYITEAVYKEVLHQFFIPMVLFYHPSELIYFPYAKSFERKNYKELMEDRGNLYTLRFKPRDANAIQKILVVDNK